MLQKFKIAAAIAVQCRRTTEGGYLVPLLVSIPGEGKTSFTKELARFMGWKWRRFILARHERSDFILPVPQASPQEEGSYIYRFALVQDLAEIASDEDNTYLIFLDEFTRAPLPVLNAFLTFIQEREMGGVHFNNIRFIIAANPPLQVLDPAFVNRCVVLDGWGIGLKEFEKGLLRGDWGDSELPVIDEEEYRKHLEDAKFYVVSFLRKFPHHYKVNKIAAPGSPFPSPRAWESVACALAGWLAWGGEDDEVLSLLVGGLVGSGIGAEFTSWFKSLNVPSWEELPPEAVKKLPVDIQYLIVCQIANFLATDGETSADLLSKVDALLSHLPLDLVGLTLHKAIDFSKDKRQTYAKIRQNFKKHLEKLVKVEDALKGGVV